MHWNPSAGWTGPSCFCTNDCHPEICLRYVTRAPPMAHAMHGMYGVSYSVIAMACRPAS